VADDRKRLTVIRNGQNKDIHQSEVMVGEVVQIFEGMEIPADALILESAELTTDVDTSLELNIF
jgi:magnesium-transporting ATPase (P-type)